MDLGGDKEEATPEQIRDAMVERFGQGTVDTVSDGVDTSAGPSRASEPIATLSVGDEPKTVHGFDTTVNSDKQSRHIDVALLNKEI